MTNQEHTHRPKKEGRSPAYPAIDLETAIQRAVEVEKVEHRHFAPVEAAIRHWNYKSLSGPALKTVSALIKYGLLETRGKGEKREVKITDFGWRILITKDGSPDKGKAIKEAALRPKINATLWNEYGSELPGDETLKLFLLDKLDFTQSAAREVIQIWARTIEFAKLGKSDILAGHEEDKMSFEEERSTMPPMSEKTASEGTQPSRTATSKAEDLDPGVGTISFPLSPKKWVKVELPYQLDEVEWKRIIETLDVFKPGFMKEASEPNEGDR